MNTRQSRAVVLVGVIASMSIAVGLALWGIGSNLNFYYPPSEAVARMVPKVHENATGTDASASVNVANTYAGAGVTAEPQKDVEMVLLQPKVKPGQHFRMGGLVAKGSLKYRPLGVKLFVVTDNVVCVNVKFTGPLPALFQEGQTVLMTGSLDQARTFMADEVLAKHDEQYDPPEVAQTLRKGVIDCSDPSRFHIVSAEQ